MKAELIAHFFLTMPPYRMTSPGMLCRETKVAAAICQALLPVSSHFGDGKSMDSPLALKRKHPTRIGGRAGMRALPRERSRQNVCRRYAFFKYLMVLHFRNAALFMLQCTRLENMQTDSKVGFACDQNTCGDIAADRILF